MKMKFKNEEMRLYVELMSLLRETGKLGYVIAKNSRKMRDEIPEYVEKRNELLQEYGYLVDKKKGEYQFEDGKQEEFEAALKEYSDMEAEIDVFQVDEDTFFNGKMTNNQMEALIWMVKGEGTPVEEEKPKKPVVKKRSVKAKVEAKVEA